ncbi:MAG: flagellar biosynthetic protein FliR, partial [Phototrophicales bacterium]
MGAWVGSFLFPLFRITSFFMVIPVIGTQLIPMRVRMSLAFVVTILVAPVVPSVAPIDAVSLNALFIVIQQVLIGSLLGFLFVMLMQLFVVAGQMIAMQMGLGFASMVDPTNGVSVP